MLSPRKVTMQGSNNTLTFDFCTYCTLHYDEKNHIKLKRDVNQFKDPPKQSTLTMFVLNHFDITAGWISAFENLLKNSIR